MGKFSNASMGNLELERALTSFDGANVAKKSITYVAGTTGATGASTLFNVEGDVLIYIFGVCKTSLAGATATLEVGVTGATAALLAQTTGTDIDVNEGWFDATPTLAEAVAPVYSVVAGGLDVIQTIATAAVSAGTIDYYCFWKPLSSDGTLAA